LTESGKALQQAHGAARNTVFSLAAQFSGALFSLGLTLFLVRSLGPTEYGILALAVSIGTIALIVSDLGISISASRFVAESPRDELRAAAILRTGFLLKAVASFIATVLLFLLAPLLADAFGSGGLTWPLRAVAIAVAAQNLGALFVEWFVGLGRVSLTLRYAFTESAAEATAAICLVLLGAGATGAAAGRAIGYAAAAALVATFAIRLVGWEAIRTARRHPFPARPILGYGSSLLLIDGAFALFDRTDVLVIGALLNATAAGIFEGAARVLALLAYPGIAVGVGYGPRLAAGQRAETDVVAFLGALRWTVLLYALLAIPTLVWAQPIVDLFLGPSFSESADVLRALAPTVFLAGVAPVLGGAANFLGEARRRVPIAALALGVNIAIDLALVPSMGITAGALGTGVAFAIFVGGHVRICQRALGVSFAPLLPTVLRALLAAIPAGLVLLAAGTDSLGPAEWILGSAGALLAYSSTLLATREVRPAELRGIIQRLKRSRSDPTKVR
jgi:O-antigen/teichoic acid export membrane protein